MTVVGDAVGDDSTAAPVFQDPSEPIYTEPSLFERSRSLRSVADSDFGRHRTSSGVGGADLERAVL